MNGMDWYDSEARFLDVTAGTRFTSPDPKAWDYPVVSPYAYSMNNPVNAVDPDGYFPRAILKFKRGGLFRADYYKLSQPAAHLLSLVSSVNENYIRDVDILERGIGHYYPIGSFPSEKGGSAITLGSNNRHVSISLTNNYFEDDGAKYNNNGFGQDLYQWFSILAHEVRHINHISKSKNEITYLTGFLYDYIKYGHDHTPREIDAEQGRITFRDFYNHINKQYGNDSLERLFDEKSDKEIIHTIDMWWNEYKNVQK